MTKFLEEAVARVRALSDLEQDRVAAMLLDFADREASEYQLTPEQVAEVELTRQEARQGLFAQMTRWPSCGGGSAPEDPLDGAGAPSCR